MKSFYKISETVQEDLSQFKREVKAHQSGQIPANIFKALRVPRGVYEQRQDGTFMVRIRIPAGGVYPEQIKQIAKISGEFGDGVLHITTRQGIQIHDVKVEGINRVTDLLLEAGLSSKGGGGNTVRNIMACDMAGVCPDETFDVAPYAVALTELFLDQEDSFDLPRKFKIAFSGCDSDCGLATINDIGFIAKEKNGVQGFRVYVAGGMGGAPRVADLLEDFITTEQVAEVATAIKRLFYKHGDRKNRHRARLRFVMEKFGFRKFNFLYREELKKVRAEGGTKLELREINLEPIEVPSSQLVQLELEHSDQFMRWKKFNVRPQKQKDLFTVTVAVPLGNIRTDQFLGLADLAEQFGEGAFRTSQNQNLSIRSVHKDQIYSVYKKLGELHLSSPSDTTDLVSCPGPDTCRLGICLSRNLGRELSSQIEESAKKVDIKINGCPHSCGQHPIAQIGLQGESRKINGDRAPYYKVNIGGRVEEGKTAFGALVGRIPAKNVPDFVNELLHRYDQDSSSSDFYRFIENLGIDRVKKLVEKFSIIPSVETDESYYCDWGRGDERFSLAGLTEGECHAGLSRLKDKDREEAERLIESLRKQN